MNPDPGDQRTNNPDEPPVKLRVPIPLNSLETLEGDDKKATDQ